MDLPAPAQLSAGGRPSTPFVPDVAGGGQPDFESTITLDGLAQAAVAARGATPFAQAARRPAAVPSPPAARPPHDFESTVELGEEDIVALSARELRAGGAAGSRAPGQPAPTEPAVPDFESTVALDPDELPPAPGRPAPPGRRG
ncbi:MAG: hypothetical protein HY744_20670 [Deltaproteobacteria bacterium]|nr:hypothetical protein [Deltaproteobacteria bacterium]